MINRVCIVQLNVKETLVKAGQSDWGERSEVDLHVLVIINFYVS